MSVFSAKLIVWNPTELSRSEEIDVLVDTGASYSWVSSSRLAGLGVRPTRRLIFRTIEGRTIERELAPVFIRVDGYTGGDTVVLAEPGDNEVLGAHTLESLGLTADPVKKALVPTVGLALLSNAGKGLSAPLDTASDGDDLWTSDAGGIGLLPGGKSMRGGSWRS